MNKNLTLPVRPVDLRKNMKGVVMVRFQNKMKFTAFLLSKITALSMILLLMILLMSCSGSESRKISSDTCDILIAGGGIGGVAAALQACSMADEHGITKIIITEETSWLGGQYTSQGVTASDDNSLVEQGRYHEASSELYYRFHEIIRDQYRAQALETALKTGRTGKGDTIARKAEIAWIKGAKFSPGNAWGSRMSFLPEDGVKAIDQMLAPYVQSGLLSIRYKEIPTEVIKEGNKVTAVTSHSMRPNSATCFRFRGPITVSGSKPLQTLMNRHSTMRTAKNSILNRFPDALRRSPIPSLSNGVPPARITGFPGKTVPQTTGRTATVSQWSTVTGGFS